MSKALIFTMHKVGSSSLMQVYREQGYSVDRGYEENIHTLLPISEYDIVATAVRDPIARNISWFFEQFGVAVLQENLRNEQIYLWLMENIDHNYPLTWFDNVFRLAMQINVYDFVIQPMPRILNKNGKALHFYKTNSLEIHRAETEATRPYGAIYHRFLEWVKFSPAYIDKMYNSKYARHFFTEEETAEWRNRWQE